MNEFVVELFIDSGEEDFEELSILNEKELNQFKIDLEAHALSEYYNRKIKISSEKI